jgi:Acyl-coenzyme A:6-aminopenicillanic acid acyl-transferase
MSTHDNYFEINVDTNYELGLRKGELFGKFMRQSIEELQEDEDWDYDLGRARSYVSHASKAFPHLIEEVHGYAEGARVCFEEAWRLIIEDELIEYDGGRCSTMITNDGTMIAHNEDWWEEDADQAICVLRRTVGGVSTLELFYMNTLGGNSVSINSHGFVQAINSLAMNDNQVGVPRNLVCRWLSDTSSPDHDLQILQGMRRASGYHHNLINRQGQIWSIECSAIQEVLVKPEAPFVHTNHYLSDLSRFENEESIRGTYTRYRCALDMTQDRMSVKGCKRLLGDVSEGKRNSLFNEWTVARVVVDLNDQVAHVWLRRESEKGWVPYDLRSLFASASSHTLVSEPVKS